MRSQPPGGEPCQVKLPPEGGPETVTYTLSPVIVTARTCGGSPTPLLNVSVAGNTVAIGVHPLSTRGADEARASPWRQDYASVSSR